MSTSGEHEKFLSRKELSLNLQVKQSNNRILESNRKVHGHEKFKESDLTPYNSRYHPVEKSSTFNLLKDSGESIDCSEWLPFANGTERRQNLVFWLVLSFRGALKDSERFWKYRCIGG